MIRDVRTRGQRLVEVRELIFRKENQPNVDEEVLAVGEPLGRGSRTMLPGLGDFLFNTIFLVVAHVEACMCFSVGVFAFRFLGMMVEEMVSAIVSNGRKINARWPTSICALQSCSQSSS